MPIDDASLTDLVAALRERLRHLDHGPAAGSGTAGPLGPGGRTALAARLLAVALADRPDAAGRDAARALEQLADALAGTPTPLPGSAWEADVTRLAAEFEALAAAWDGHDPLALARAWQRLREVGDRLFADPQTAAPAPPAASPTRATPPQPPPAATIWLLVTGTLRRRTLQARLTEAGLGVVCPADAAAVTARLSRERPAAVVCDDAAPTRHWSELRDQLPADAPPLVLVRARSDGGMAGGAVWLPPYRPEDLFPHLPPC
jgi:hypothetical protein